MPKYINADYFYGRIKNTDDIYTKYFLSVLVEKALSEADVVEVVRCKDCKFYNPAANVGYLAYCDLAENYEHLDPEWYCCHAERRESE